MRFYLETERLILREILDSDLNDMFELDSNPEVHKYLGKEPIRSIEESQNIIDGIKKQYQERGIGRWAAIEKTSGNFIGWSGLKFNTGDKEALGDKRDFYDVGYRFIPRYWGKGYATESALAAMDYGFKSLHLETIVGAAETGNIASNKVLKKIGLQFVELFPLDNVMINWYKLNKYEYA